MHYYTVAQLEITDSRWVRRYAQEVTRMVEEAGGRYLARTGSAELLEGSAEPPAVFLIIEWPSREVAQAFYSSQAYAEHLAARLRGSTGNNWLVPGVDDAGLAGIGGQRSG